MEIYEDRQINTKTGSRLIKSQGNPSGPHMLIECHKIIQYYHSHPGMPVATVTAQ